MLGDRTSYGDQSDVDDLRKFKSFWKALIKKSKSYKVCYRISWYEVYFLILPTSGQKLAINL